MEEIREEHSLSGHETHQKDEMMSWFVPRPLSFFLSPFDFLLNMGRRMEGWMEIGRGKCCWVDEEKENAFAIFWGFEKQGRSHSHLLELFVLWSRFLLFSRVFSNGISNGHWQNGVNMERKNKITFEERSWDENGSSTYCFSRIVCRFHFPPPLNFYFLTSPVFELGYFLRIQFKQILQKNENRHIEYIRHKIWQVFFINLRLNGCNFN